MKIDDYLLKTNVSLVSNFLDWLNQSDSNSYDQYDFWSTAYGQFSKKIYYRNPYLGIALVSPLVLLDNFFPSSRKFFVTRKRFPIADAHYSLAFLNLYKLTSNKKYLEVSHNFLKILLKTSINTETGLSWGYPFNWETLWGNYPKGTPLITTAPYCLEAFIYFQKYGIEGKFSNEINLIINSLTQDFPFASLENNQKSSNYSSINDNNCQVINASSYRAYGLVLASTFKNNPQYLDESMEYINFVISSQNSDGSWYYSCESSSTRFVDHIHTCFILKNLVKSNEIIRNDKISSSIERGMKYYRENLFDKSKLPIPFSERHRFQTSARELYDFAEAINILSLESYTKNKLSLKKIINFLELKMITDKGSFVTRQTMFSNNNEIPYHRWAQSQTFKSLTELLTKICAE